MGIEPISKTIEAVFEKISSSKKDEEQMIRSVLTEALNRKEAAHMRPFCLHKKVLTIHVDSPGWMYAMNLKKNKLLKILQEKAGVGIINEIRLRIGPLK